MNKKTNGNKDLDQAAASFDAFNDTCKELTLDNMNKAPLVETEPQSKVINKEMPGVKPMKPSKVVQSMQKFNEKFRKEMEFKSELVYFQVENHEIIGEGVSAWTRPYGGMPAEFWEVPVNQVVLGPRYLAEQLNECKYHRLVMKETSSPNNQVASDATATYYGKIVADSTVHRISAKPVSNSKSIFVGNY